MGYEHRVQRCDTLIAGEMIISYFHSLIVLKYSLKRRKKSVALLLVLITMMSIVRNYEQTTDMNGNFRLIQVEI